MTLGVGPLGVDPLGATSTDLADVLVSAAQQVGDYAQIAQISPLSGLSAGQTVGLFAQSANLGAGDWSTLDEWSETINSTPWDGYTHRVRVDRTKIPGSAGTKVRLTYRAHASGVGASTTAVYIGVAADSGDGYDFDGTPVEVTFGGLSGFSIAAGSTITSDEITLSLDGARDLLIAGQTASGQPGGFAGNDGRTGWQAWYKSGADAATADATGYFVNAVEAVGVVKIEAYYLPDSAASLSAAQSIGGFSQAASLAADAGISAGQSVGAFVQAATATADAGLVASQSVGGFGQSVLLSSSDAATLLAAQSVGVFGQAAATTVDLTLQASQSIGAFGQDAQAIVLPVAGLSGAQAVGSYSQTAALAPLAGLSASQSVGSYAQTAMITLEEAARLSASQQVGSYGQSAGAQAWASAIAWQQVGSYGQAVTVTTEDAAGLSAAQQLGAYGQAVTVETEVSAVAVQQVGGYAQAAAAEVLLQASANQQIAPYGQVVRVLVFTGAGLAPHPSRVMHPRGEERYLRPRPENRIMRAR